MSDIATVGVVGCGLMGSGMAEVCARAGLEVIVREVDDAAAEAGRERIAASLARAVEGGKLDTLRSVAGSMYEEFKEPLRAVPPLLCRRTAAGMLGRESRRGFYDHEER